MLNETFVDYVHLIICGRGMMNSWDVNLTMILNFVWFWLQTCLAVLAHKRVNHRNIEVFNLVKFV